jgi:hypothetical protein
MANKPTRTATCAHRRQIRNQPPSHRGSHGGAGRTRAYSSATIRAFVRPAASRGADHRRRAPRSRCDRPGRQRPTPGPGARRSHTHHDTGHPLPHPPSGLPAIPSAQLRPSRRSGPRPRRTRRLRLHRHRQGPDRPAAPASKDPAEGCSRPGRSVQSASGPNRTSAPEHTRSTQPSTMDMKTAPIRQETPGQGLDHGCAARDSNPEPAD